MKNTQNISTQLQRGGGFMTKVKGTAASVAPCTSVIALTVALGSAPALAQTVQGEIAGGTGLFGRVVNGDDITLIDPTFNGAINGAPTFTGAITINGTTTTNGIINIGNVETDTLTVNGLTNTTGISNTGDISNSGNVGVAGDLGVTGQSFTTGISNTGDISNSGNVGVGGNLGVTGQSFTNGISDSGDIGTSGNMFVGENLSVVGQSFLTNTTVDGQLGVTGNATVSGDLAVGGQTFTNGISDSGDIGTSGNMFVGENLSVVGQSFLSNTTVDGELGVTSNATVLGNTNLGGTLNVEGATTLQSTLLVEGATTINDTLLVSTEEATFDVNDTSANLTVDDGTNASSLALTSTNVSLTNNGSGMTSVFGATTVTGITQTIVTGGTTSMLVSNSGVNFSGAGGAPVRLSGVADGIAPFDAVNVRQLEQVDLRLSAGIAGTMAMTQLPTISAGESFSFGIALGNYNSQSALAMGGAVRVTDSMTVRGAMQHSSTGGTGGAVGLGWSW